MLLSAIAKVLATAVIATLSSKENDSEPEGLGINLSTVTQNILVKFVFLDTKNELEGNLCLMKIPSW